MIIRNSKFKQVIPDSFTYKGTKYTKAYAKGKLLFANTDDDYAFQYFTIESLEDGNVITLSIPANLTTNDMTSVSYSTDNGTTWNTTTIDGTAKTINVNLDNGDKLLWKGLAKHLNNSYGSEYGCHFTSSGEKQWMVYGNIMSLLFGDDFYSHDMSDVTVGFTFYGLFNTGTSTDGYLVDAENLVIPGTNSARTHLYSMMFKNNTGLVKAPKVLPATVGTSVCYYQMFYGCTSLVSAPEIKVTSFTGQQNCFQMFNGCTSLVKAPELPATTLTQSCYASMFYGCTSLTEAPELPTATLTQQCYQYMFNGCTSLNYIKCLATDISATYCTTGWVTNVASTGTFVKADGMNDWTIDSVDGIPIGWTVQDYIEDYEQEYFTIKSLEDGNVITLSIPAALTTSDMTDISYSTDNGTTWNTTTIDGTAKTVTVNLDTGDKVIWKGNGLRLSTTTWNSSKFNGSKQHNVYGNVMSLLYGDNFSSQTTIYEYSFANMFSNDTHLIDSSNLVLLADNLPQRCYAQLFDGCTSLTSAPKLTATTLNGLQCYSAMFQNCTSLTTAPELLATTLSLSCYRNMFNGCTSLTTAPELPATTLATYCYSYMFKNCTSLTTAPVLPATTLIQECYDYMFDGCTSLSYIKCLATNISASNCTRNWVNNVAATGTFVKADGMNDWVVDSVNGIPTGWTVRENSNYTSQYFTIESLEDGNEVKFTKPSEVSTTIFQSISYSTDGTNWTTIQNVDNQPIDQSLGILNTGCKMYFKGSASAYATGNEYGNVWRYSTLLTNKTCNVYGNMMSLLYGDNFSGQTSFTSDYVFFGMFDRGNVVSAADLVLPATNMTFCCYKYLFSNNTTLTTPPVLPSTSLADQCYEGMFIGCSSLATAPALPATTTVGASYQYMFSGCSSLATAPALPATTLSKWCYRGMFEYCTSLATAPTLAVNHLESQCYEGMFKGCTSLQTITLPATNLGWACYFHMLEGCTSLEAIDLPATAIVEYCYDSIIAKCTGLKSVSVHAVTSGYSIDFGAELAASGTYYVPRTATGYILSACPTGWTISKTLS